MKKIISMALVLVMLLTIPCMAATVDDVLKTPMTSGVMDLNYKIKLNQPLSSEIDPEGTITKTIESFDIGAKIDLISSEDQKQIKAKILMDMSKMAQMMGEQVPKMEMWLDMDLNNENPKYQTIMKMENEEKYIVMDLFKLIDKDVFAGMLSNQELVKMDYSKLTTVTEGENSATLSMSKDTIMDLLTDVYEPILSSMTEKMQMSEVEAAQLNLALKMIKNINIFADDALVLDVKWDENKLLTAMNMKVNLKFNIYEIATMFGTPAEKIDPLTKENSNIDASILYDIKISDMNKPVEIDFPEITADNSITYEDMISQQADIDMNSIYVTYNEKPINFEVQPKVIDGRTLVPIRALANSFGVKDDDISYNDETKEIIIKYLDNTVKMTVNSKEAFINDKAIELDVPATEIDGRTLVPLRFISENFEKDVKWIEFGKGSTGGMIFINDK